ncbi:MAG: DUF5053 domain-containing protein [Bacteroidaceae bacterium]|nr:DUF5053 domain-containing protein [Bacteroidaceae bacterium]
MARNVVNENVKIISDMKSRMDDILLAISWREMARNYFGKSPSWFYHKMNGIDGNGGKGGFTEQEAETLRNALLDLSSRLQSAASKILPDSDEKIVEEP